MTYSYRASTLFTFGAALYDLYKDDVRCGPVPIQLGSMHHPIKIAIAHTPQSSTDQPHTFTVVSTVRVEHEHITDLSHAMHAAAQVLVRTPRIVRPFHMRSSTGDAFAMLSTDATCVRAGTYGVIKGYIPCSLRIEKTGNPHLRIKLIEFVETHRGPNGIIKTFACDQLVLAERMRCEQQELSERMKRIEDKLYAHLAAVTTLLQMQQPSD